MKISDTLQLVIGKLLLLFAISQLSLSLEIIIAYTDNSYSDSDKWNETSILEVTQSPNSSVDWHKCEISHIEDCIENYPGSLILLDLSSSLDVQNKIAHLCNSYLLIHLVLENRLKFDDEWTFSIVSSKNQQMNAFLSALNYLNWSQGIAFNNKENFDIKEKLENFSNKFKFLAIESKSSIKELINKIVFREGATVYSVFTDFSESLEIQKQLKQAKLLSAGNGIILSQESGYQCTTDGALIIADYGQMLTNSSEEYFKNSIINAISYILSHISKETTQEILSVLKIKPENSKFSLVNIQHGERIAVGTITNGNVLISNNMTFPGNSKTIPKSTKKILNLSINAGATNPNALPAKSGVIGARGAWISRDEINEGHTILSNFQLSFFNYDCGATVYDATFAYNCFLKDINKFGLGHISSYGSSVAVGALSTFKSLNVSIPVVGCTNSDSSLNVTKTYPMYTRVGFSTTYASSLLSVLIKVLGWKKIAILYQNDLWAISRSWYLNPAIASQGLEVMNPESTWYIPANLDRDTIKNYTNVFQQIIDSQARLLIVTVQSPMCNFILEMLYDLGMRKGDMLIFATYLDMLTIIGTNDTFLYKRLEVGVPMFRMIQQNWIGEIGEKAKAKVMAAYKEPTNAFTCPYYDGVYLLAHALDFMINRGQDYTDPKKLEAVIRTQQFQGCTGRVTIEKGTNDRIVDGWDIEVSEVDQSNAITTKYIGKLKPFSSQILSIANPIVYPDGTTNKPSDLRNEDSKCPFPDKEVRTFDKGRGLLFGICFTVAVVSFGITILIWKKWWNISIEELKQKEEISIEDTIVAASIAIEFFQYAAMGPDFDIMSSTLGTISKAFSLSLWDILNFSKGTFWIIVDIVFGGIAAWAILCAVVLFRLDEKWRFLSIFRFLSWLADYLMPILGNLCFIPFIAICLDIFLCDQSIGDDFTDSFLARDCYYFCWKDEHLTYAIVSFFALLLYVPLAIFCRPLWQELQHMLHVKAAPLYLMVKSVIQITLIVMNKTIKRSQNIVHGALFIVVMTIYIVFSFKFKPYNYPRFSWWEGLSLIGVVWLAFLSTIAIGIKGDFMPILIILIGGWLVIVMIGLYVQKKKYPSLLFRKTGKDTSTLFKFAFTFTKGTFSKSRIKPNDIKNLD